MIPRVLYCCTFALASSNVRTKYAGATPQAFRHTSTYITFGTDPAPNQRERPHLRGDSLGVLLCEEVNRLSIAHRDADGLTPFRIRT